jgi:hypothetical protein
MIYVTIAKTEINRFSLLVYLRAFKMIVTKPKSPKSHDDLSGPFVDAAFTEAQISPFRSP